MTGRDIKETLERAGVLPSKQLGQNFLIDPNMARWIVSQLEPQAEDTIVEVGPGTGALTEHLIGQVKRLVLIEFDARLAAALAERFKDDPTIEVHHADGAKFDRRTLFKHRPVKFLGNLPYSCGGAILKNMLSSPHPFQRAVIMLQKEVITRLAAQPGTKDYGILSLCTQVNWHVEPKRTVPPEAFHPRPKIDSSVAVMTPRKGGFPAFDQRLFDELIRRGFAQRRKQLKKQLPENTPWEDISTQLGVPVTTRAEELTLDQWVQLTRFCDTHPLKDIPQHADELFDVVNQNDEVIGQKTRAEVHAQGLKHRAVHVFVFHKKGDLLMQQRSMFKDIHPGIWGSSVSGHLDAGEDYLSAAIRELEEEMGIQTTPDKLEEIGRIEACEQTGQEHIRIYRTTYQGNLRYPAAEVQAATWLPLAELQAWIAASPQDFSPGFLTCWHATERSRLPSTTQS